MTDRLLVPTPLLDYDHSSIERLITSRGWRDLALYDQIGAVYAFVRDEITFGYNTSDDLKASEVLADGFGQCNTKATLLMALLRAVGVPCRLHGFTIHKSLQKGVVTGIFYGLAPQDILHSWVEIRWDGNWIDLEGFILDKPYLAGVQARFGAAGESFCGYGVGTTCLSAPPIDWVGRSTYIQKEGINADLGVYDAPDEFYREHGTNITGWRRWLFQNWIRHRMNKRVADLRSGAPVERMAA